MGRPEPKLKSFDISKRLVFEAWEKVRDNAGAPGVDAVSVSQFQEQERDSLYKLWNRMSAGSYMPGPVRAVERAGALALAVGVAFDDELVAGGGEPVDGGLG